MNSDNNEDLEFPQIDESNAVRLSFIEKYKRGLTLVEVAAVGALPFIVLWMVGGLVGLCIAIPLALLAPPMIYDAFQFSAKRGARDWLTSSKIAG